MINQKLKHAVTGLLAKAFLLITFLLPLNTNAEGTKTPSRIITAGGSVTEIFYELGLGDQVVAIDTSSLFPPSAMKLPKVGYFRSLTTEGLMSLNPDMLVAAKGVGPATVLKQIETLGVEVKTYEQSNYTLGSWKKLINGIGEDFNKTHLANNLISKVTENITKHQAKRTFTKNKINAIALLSIGQRGPIAAGKNTVPDLLLELSGINNVAESIEGYKPFSTELLAEQKVDILLIPSHVIASLGSEDTVCENQIIQLATAGKCNLFVMDGLLLMGFGTRLDQSVEQIITIANGI